MTDFLGRELNVGDKVVYLQHNKTFSELFQGVVIGFTPKKVKLQHYAYGIKSSQIVTKYPDIIVKVDW